MVRYLLISLAVLVAVLAYLFDRPWLWIVAGAVLVGGIGYLGWEWWSAQSEHEEDRGRPDPDPEGPNESLEDLGIMDIRPEDEEREDGATPSVEADDHAATQSPESSAEGGGVVSEKGGVESKEKSEDPATGSEESTRASTATAGTADAPVLEPLLESLRSALDAQTVTVLIQEEVALTYEIEALVSTHSKARTSGSFDTQTPLVTATMSRTSVTVRSLENVEVAIEDLGYYKVPLKVDQFAIAPVPRPRAPSTTFLLADAKDGTDLDRSEARSILKQYAETVGVLLDARSSRSQVEATPSSSGAESGGASEGNAENEEESPRPRREIIAEEMEAVDRDAEDLALILVHLNRAESIARRGEDAVASAERLLEARLEQQAPNHRVERFGELTFGILYRGDAANIESWVANLEDRMAKEEGELEGGVSVGVAIWTASREEPEALRSDATDALHEAYKTGTSTIVG